MIYIVKIKFDSSNTFIFDKILNESEISVSSAPVKGKANKEIVQKISDYFNVKTQGKNSSWIAFKNKSSRYIYLKPCLIFIFLSLKIDLTSVILLTYLHFLFIELLIRSLYLAIALLHDSVKGFC